LILIDSPIASSVEYARVRGCQGCFGGELLRCGIELVGIDLRGDGGVGVSDHPRDHTSGTPVTNFRRSNRLYRQNRGLDRDKDGIACEKK